MLTNVKKRTEGFTIIEVLIVLAIAGLIMLIVFLAVPALQRNSRNTQRKSDVSSLLGSAQEVLNNNNGKVSSLTEAALVAVAPEAAYYDYTVAANLVVASGAQAAVTNADFVVLATGAKCGTAGAAVAGTTRQMAVIYAVEAGSGVTSVCTNS
jgi:prepilin-type N-terminal cleavage/methylation domain-containing protein